MDPRRGFNRDETDSEKMAYAKYNASYCVPLANGTQENEYLATYCKQHIQKVDDNKNVCE
jgi:hypothetical protein